jgi:hypothetical protein
MLLKSKTLKSWNEVSRQGKYMVISYIHSICWRMKSAFYEHQQRRQDPAPCSGGSRTFSEGGVPPQVDGDYPKNIVGTGQLPLLISPTIANIRLYHIQVDDGTTLNLITLAAFRNLQILMLKLTSLHPFSRVGPVPIMLHGSISLPVMFGTP